MPILITSKKHNFRRAGVAHPKDVTEYPDDRFSKEELKILKAEPMLTVEIVKPEPAEVEKKPTVAKTAKATKRSAAAKSEG